MHKAHEPLMIDELARSDAWRRLEVRACQPSHSSLYGTQILGRHDEEWVHPVPLFFVTGGRLKD